MTGANLPPDLPRQLAEMQRRVRELERRAARAGILDTYEQYGQNAAYAGINALGQGCYVDAAQSIPLQWVYTPPVDVWAEATTFVGDIDQNGSATWEYLYLIQSCSPAPEFGPTDAEAILSQHASAPYGFRTITKRWALVAGTTYTIANSFQGSGGAVWNYFQGAAHLYMEGKTWAR